MTHALPDTAQLDQSARIGGTNGILAAAALIPADVEWQRGVSVLFDGCGTPVLQGGCATGPSVPQGVRPEMFEPLSIRSSAACTPMSQSDLATAARDRSEQTAEYALGRQLMDDAAGLGNPSLADATDLGNFADAEVCAALSCLENEAAQRGAGQAIVIHADPRAATYLMAAGLVDPATGRTLLGSRVIASPGYASDDTDAHMWATGQVWRALDPVNVVEDLDYRRNNSEVWADRLGIVVFDPCLNFHISFTVGACPVPNP